MMYSARRTIKKSAFLRLPALFTFMVFIIAGCGGGTGGNSPGAKVLEPNAGQFALDFSSCPQNVDVPDFDETCFVSAGQGAPSLADTEFTIEAWVNDQAVGLDGGIFSRAHDDAGITMYINNSVPQFAMKKDGDFPYLVNTGFTLVEDEWTHIAASLTTEDHSTGPNAHGECIGGTGWATSIAVDSSDNVHISYMDSTNGLNYATGTLGSWVTSRVDTVIEAGQLSTSIDTDSNDSAHISYYDTLGGTLKYADNTSGTWATSTGLDSNGDTIYGEYSALAIDSLDVSHITYYHNNAASLNVKYTSNFNAPDWYSTAIGGFSGTDGGKYISIAAHPSNSDIYTTYYDDTNNYLRFSTGHYTEIPKDRVFNDKDIVLDNTGNVGKFTSITRDSLGVLHVSYYDESNTALKYISCPGTCGTPGNWTSATIDNSDSVGQYTSIASDSANGIHISYYDETNGDLKYAYCAAACTVPGNWALSTVDNGGTSDVGQFSSIDVDSAGNAHISYFDSTEMRLLYATNQHFAWNLNIVDAGDARTEATHLDMFVNGNFMSCSPTGGNFSDALDTRIAGGGVVIDVTEAIGPSQVVSSNSWASLTNPNPINPGNNLDAIVDDVRFWTTGRTQTQISQCMDQELTISGGPCAIDSSILKGYWTFNSGQGIDTPDHSGAGSGGTKQTCDNQDNGDGAGGGPDNDTDDPEDVDCAGPTADNGTTDWAGGWTTNTPF